MSMSVLMAPKAWHKMRVWMTEASPKEVSMLGETHPEHADYIVDVHLIGQEVASSSTEIKDEELAKYTTAMLKAGKQMRDFMGVWIHSHPFSKGVPTPSSSSVNSDEETFKRVFGERHWAMMIVVSGDMDMYCRVQINNPFKVTLVVPVVVDWESLLEMNDEELKKEYVEKVTTPQITMVCTNHGNYWGGKIWVNGKGWVEEEEQIPFVGNDEGTLARASAMKSVSNESLTAYIVKVDSAILSEKSKNKLKHTLFRLWPCITLERWMQMIVMRENSARNAIVNSVRMSRRNRNETTEATHIPGE